MLNIFSEDNRILILLARERLTDKQKHILNLLTDLSKDARSITKIVEEISERLNCSKSNIWENVRALKRVELVSWENGIPMKLTKYGEIISRELYTQLNYRRYKNEL